MSIGKAVIRPLRDALDDMPVHVRQLSEMFRKHGQKQNRNVGGVTDLDATDVPTPLQNGWKPDGWTPNDVVGAGKGDRPDPGDYLDGDYVRQHLDQFADGATRIYRKSSLEDWGPGNNGTTYVFPTDQLQDVIDRSPTPQLLMTQEMIAGMLGVRRESITDAAGRLQRAGLISYRRGHISVLDRAGLEAGACECYALLRKESQEVLFGHRQHSLEDRAVKHSRDPKRFGVRATSTLA